MKLKSRGENLSRKELEELANNYVISKHAFTRLKERNLSLDKIKDIILNPYLAYFNTDKSINVCKDNYYYLVFTYCEKEKKFVLVTYKEPSKSKVSVVKKQMYASLGLDRNKFR